MRFTHASFLCLSLLLLILFAGAVAIFLKMSQSYFVRQLDAHARDTASVLAVALGEPLAEGDAAMAETLLRAMCDRGRYTSMEVVRHYQKFAEVRREPTRTEGVPAWFAELLPLQGSPQRAEIFSGWKKIGEIRVAGYPGMASEQLWRIGRHTLLLFAGIWLAAFLVLTGMLSLLLVPLKQMEKQARAIADRNFQVNPRRPWFREFAAVAEALNQMAATIRTMIADQAEIIARLRCRASRDPITGLDIFEYFRHAEPGCQGNFAGAGKRAAVLVHVSGVGELNRRVDRAFGDRIMRLLAERFTQGCRRLDPHGLVCRIAGAGFFAVMKHTDLDRLRMRLPLLLAELRRDLPAPADEVLDARAGAVCSEGAQPLTELFLRAQSVLASVPLSWQGRVLAEPDLAAAVSASGSDIERFTRHSIATGAFELLAVPVVCPIMGNLQHRKLHLRFHNTTWGTLRAGRILPVAERLGLLAELHRKMVERAIGMLRGEADTTRYAVHLSPRVLLDQGFRQWLLEKLTSLGTGERQRLLFETGEAVCAEPGVAVLVDYLERMKEMGCGFGIDHFGILAAGFSLLPALKPDYVKIDRGLLTDINRDEGYSNLIETMTTCIHGLGIACIAPLVEGTDRQRLAALGVDCVMEPVSHEGGEEKGKQEGASGE
ncbi:MAG: EAL domain-containing protein [Thermodesulfobacteriota bacterium]